MTSTTSGSSSQSGVQQVKEQVQDVAQQAKGQTREQLRTQIDERSTQAGDQLVSSAQALRRASDQLRQEGNDRMADAIEAVISRAERLGGYMRTADGNKILHDVEDFGRRQPWLMVGGSAVLGFLASRFMKASSSGRYQSRYPQRSGYPSQHMQGDGGSAGYMTPPAIAPSASVPVGSEGRRQGVGTGGGAGGVAGGRD